MFVPTRSVLHWRGAASGIKGHTRKVTTATRETRLRAAHASTEAMRIFYRKHYIKRYPKIVMWLVFAGITLLASVALSIVIMAIILMLGRNYGFLSFYALGILILLSAPMFPIEMFPGPVQAVSSVMPYTYVFESIRMLIATGAVQVIVLLKGLAVSLAYFIASIPIFALAFKEARKRGTLVRMM